MSDLPKGLPTTETHWRQAARDYGWPHDFGLVVEFWVPVDRDAPRAWFARFMDTSRQEAVHAARRDVKGRS